MSLETAIDSRTGIPIGPYSTRYYQSSDETVAGPGFADQLPSLQVQADEVEGERERRRPGLVRVQSIHSRTLRESLGLPQI